MKSKVINLHKKSIDRIQEDLKDEDFWSDLEGATNILVLVQKDGVDGMVNHIVYATEDFPNLVYLLNAALYLVLSGVKE